MIQNDTLDSSDVNKMSTPALERLFIEVSNASTTLVNNNYTGYEMVNDNVNDIELNANNANANINNNNNSTILNGSSNGSYGNLHHPLSYPSHDGNLNDNLQHQPSSHNNTNTNHVINHHHHVTNPVFPCNDSLLSESLPGNIHRSSRLVPPEYNHLNHHHSNGNSSANHHNHNSNSHNLSGDGAGPSLHVNGGVYSTPNHLQNHSLAQPSSVASSSTIPISMSSVSSPVTLTTLSSSSTTTNGGVVVPISTSSNCGLMQVKNEQSEQMASGSNSNGNQIITSNNHAHNGLNNCPSGSSSSSSSQSASGPGPVTPSASLTISPPVSPIDMEEQEKFKLERKRQRNRIAASKCRKRKLEKIHLLEKRVNELKDENEQLSTKVNKLRDHVCCLKREVIQHINSGCPIASPDQHQQPL